MTVCEHPFEYRSIVKSNSGIIKPVNVFCSKCGARLKELE